MFYNVIPPFLKFLGSTRLAAQATTTSSVTIEAMEQLVLLINIAGYSANDIAALQFNGDTANNYWDRHLVSAAGATTFSNKTNTSGPRIQLADANSTLSRASIVNIQNRANLTKSVKIKIQTATNATGTAGITDVGGGGEWVNTTNSITSIQLVTTNGKNFLSGTSFTVWGYNPT